MKINNEKEKNAYFSKTIKNEGAYFIVTFPTGETEFIWVEKYENWTDGSDWYWEHSTLLLTHDVTGESLEPYYDDELKEMVTPYECCYIENNAAYEISSYPYDTSIIPFLPESFDIVYVTDDEIEAIKFMMKLDKYESLEEDKKLAVIYGEDIIRAEANHNNAKSK